MIYKPNTVGKCLHGHAIVCPLEYGQGNEYVGWRKREGNLHGGYWVCSECHRNSVYRGENQERNKKRCQNRKRTIKKEIMDWYGCKCRCCGEQVLSFLTIDHITDDGVREYVQKGNARSNSGRGNCGAGIHFYYRLKKLGYEKRPLDLQILCWNCQWGKRLNNGFCPHHPAINLSDK